MDLDLSCVSAIATEGRKAYDLAISKGLKAERFQGEAASVFSFLANYVKKYPDSWPTPDMLGGATGMLLDTPENTAVFWIDQVVDRNLYVNVQKAIEDASGLLQQLKPQEAFKLLDKQLEEMRKDSSLASPVQSLLAMGPEVWAYYQRIKSGERGIQTLWSAINDMTFGFWPEDLVLFAARIATGKSWLMVLLALYAWQTPMPKTGKACRVLFITTEISKIRIGMRFFSALERLPYSEFTHGRLGFLAEERMKKRLFDIQDAEGLYIIGGDFDFRIESVEQAIERCKPDVVFVDGVYLLQAEGPNRTERMASIFNELKRLAKRRQVAFVITTQLNRGSKKGQTDTVGLDNIALSDVGGWNADLIFALTQTEDNKRDKQMTIQPLKVREGAGSDFVVNWNFDRMDFSELVAAGGGGGDADEKGASLGSGDDEDMPF